MILRAKFELLENKKDIEPFCEGDIDVKLDPDDIFSFLNSRRKKFNGSLSDWLLLEARILLKEAIAVETKHRLIHKTRTEL